MRHPVDIRHVFDMIAIFGIVVLVWTEVLAGIPFVLM